MSVFKFFSQLPAELRLMIWELALAEELANRLVILYQFRIVPTSNIVSPLLFVNAESRACALALYSMKVTIYRIPPLKPDEELAAIHPIWMEHEQALDSINIVSDNWMDVDDTSADDEDEDMENDTDDTSADDEDEDMENDIDESPFVVRQSLEDIVEDPDADPALWSSLAVVAHLGARGSDYSDGQMFLDDVHRVIRDVERVGQVMGTIYVSAQHDRFLIANKRDGDTSYTFWWQSEPGEDMTAPFWAEASAEFRGVSVADEQLSWKSISSRLSTTDLQNIETVVLAENLRLFFPDAEDLNIYIPWGSTRDYDDYKAPFCCTLNSAKQRWKAGFFPGLKTWDHIWYRNDLLSFLLDVVNKPARELDIQRWTPSTENCWDGESVPTLVEHDALMDIERDRAEDGEWM
ncbi:hypothetical protein F5Y18DRAFT_429728 [Xylariaceae sp. FL1019]|nr:hypothetical protein F5Y18DRAFT_429728 [Xylariaceae sp. FL1019]